MRILFLSILLFSSSKSLLSQSLVINTIVGSNTYSVSEINKMTYSNDSLHIYLSTNSKVSYPLSDIKNHTFNLGSSGINNIDSKDYFQVFPNPTNDFICIHYKLTNQKSTSIELFDMNGCKIYKSPNYKCLDGDFETQFDINSLVNNYKGLLFIKVIDESGLVIFSEKISII
jgi:hypothetical protein